MYHESHPHDEATGAPNDVPLPLSSTVPNLGDGVSLVALPLLAATISRDPVLVSLPATSEQLPWLLVSLHTGEEDVRTGAAPVAAADR